MTTIKLTSLNNNDLILKQTPGRKGIWGGYKFFLNDDRYACDYWVVYDSLIKDECAQLPKGNTVLITAEPPAVKKYNNSYTKQFSKIITCQRNIKNATFSQQAMPWRIGFDVTNLKVTKDYDFFKNHKYSKRKKKLISLITSNKVNTEGHKKRLDFARFLKQRLGNKIDVYGDNIKLTPDKWDAINNYEYNIAIENSSLDDYWTEKLADAYLGGAFPIYFGCTNIEKYFSNKSMSIIDINDFKKAEKQILEATRNNLYNKHWNELKIARNLILDKYNLFQVIKEMCPPIRPKTAKQITTLHKEKKNTTFSFMGHSIFFMKLFKN